MATSTTTETQEIYTGLYDDRLSKLVEHLRDDSCNINFNNAKYQGTNLNFEKEDGLANGDVTTDGDSMSMQSNTNTSTSSIESNYYTNKVLQFMTQYSTKLKTILGLLFIVGYTVYLYFALQFELAKTLFIFTAIALCIIAYRLIRDYFGNFIYEHFWLPCEYEINKRQHVLKWIVYPLIVTGLALYMVVFVVTDIKQIQSLAGIVVFVCVTYLSSKHPDQIKWRPVLWGYGVQLMIAILALHWEPGYQLLRICGDEIARFMNYGYDGAAHAYGDPYMILHPFSMMGLSLIFYMGAVLSILYYYGFTQMCIVKISWLIQVTMHTTAVETLALTCNVFHGGMDGMLIFRKYLDKLTRSEFHTFAVGGHATLGGFIFGLFVLFGVPSQHLLCASIMTIPGVIAITKLTWSETEESSNLKIEDVQFEKGDETNVFEAFSNGATVAGKVVAAILLNYIAILSLLAWFNATVAWLAGRVGYPEFRLEEICSILFWPVAYLMGVDVQDCSEVAKIIGVKIFTMEILAFQDLGHAARSGLISARSSAITTYAICGFSSWSSMAIAVGVWQSACPQKGKDMASTLGRCIFNANMCCFMSACFAGLMFREDLVTDPGGGEVLESIMAAIPGYRDLMTNLPEF